MAEMKQVYKEVRTLDQELEKLFRVTLKDNYELMEEIAFNWKDAEEIFQAERLIYILGKLREAHEELKYLSKPVKEQGYLHKNSSGRYELSSGTYVTCGSYVEALVDDGFYDVPGWVCAAIEHDGRDYYLVGYSGVPLEGLQVRIR